MIKNKKNLEKLRSYSINLVNFLKIKDFLLKIKVMFLKLRIFF
jgi:hypothetical protein